MNVPSTQDPLITAALEDLAESISEDMSLAINMCNAEGDALYERGALIWNAICDLLGYPEDQGV